MLLDKLSNAHTQALDRPLCMQGMQLSLYPSQKVISALTSPTQLEGLVHRVSAAPSAGDSSPHCGHLCSQERCTCMYI